MLTGFDGGGGVQEQGYQSLAVLSSLEGVTESTRGLEEGQRSAGKREKLAGVRGSQRVLWEPQGSAEMPRTGDTACFLCLPTAPPCCLYRSH